MSNIDILESYMDQKIVAAENDAHKQKTLYKWLTYIVGGLGVFGLVGVAKSDRGFRLKKKYYSH